MSPEPVTGRSSARDERVALATALEALLPGARRVPGGLDVRRDGAGDPVARLVLDPREARAASVPVLHLAPLFPGSLRYRGVLSLVDGGGNRDGRPDAAGNVVPFPTSRALPVPLEPDWHFASMTWRPTPGHAATVDAGVLRVVAFTVPTDADPVAAAAAIAGAHATLERRARLEIVGAGAMPRRIAARLTRCHGIVARPRASAASPRAFFDALAGADIALLDAADGRVADAIDCGVAVRLRRLPGSCRAVPAGYADASLHAAFPDLPRQRAWLEERLRPTPERTIVANDRRALHDALRTWLLDAVGSERLPSLRRPDDGERVVPLPDAGRPRPLRVALRFDTSRRKLAKFRESPVRFVRDSRHPLLRPLAKRRP